MEIEVECEAVDSGAAVVPRGFRLGARRYRVGEILDRWLAADCSYLRVRADDGQLYVLRHDRAHATWTLAAFTRVAAPRSPAPPCLEIPGGRPC